MELDKIKNEYNPFSHGDSEELAEMLKKIMMTEEQIKKEKN